MEVLQHLAAGFGVALTPVEQECVYTDYIKREDKVAACLQSNVDAVLPLGFEYQVTCDKLRAPCDV